MAFVLIVERRREIVSVVSNVIFHSNNGTVCKTSFISDQTDELVIFRFVFLLTTMLCNLIGLLIRGNIKIPSDKAAKS